MKKPTTMENSCSGLNGTENIKTVQELEEETNFSVQTKKNMTSVNIPLVEAAELEMSMVPAKTPVSVLQELLSRRGTTPKYELVQIEGAIHEPTFRYRVTFGDAVALGTGRSKKEAKHAAAKNVLEKLVGSAMNDDKTVSANTVTINQVVNSFDKISGNPIGTLQEMCISRRWPPPTYEMTCEEGLPHERQFTMACLVFRFREVGSGKSKKLAKRQAAYKMWEKLQECPPDSTQLNYNDDMNQAFNSLSNKYEDLKNSKISTLTTAHSYKVSLFHKSLAQSTGIKLNELQIIPLNSNGCDFNQILKEIAVEQKFEITYVHIEEKSISGQCQCLVQLSTLPVAVCYGSGSSFKEAESCASHNALEYLKIMTRKRAGCPRLSNNSLFRACKKIQILNLVWSKRNKSLSREKTKQKGDIQSTVDKVILETNL